MMPMAAKIRALLLISLLLCSSLATLAARPEPASSHGVPTEAHHQVAGAEEEVEAASCVGVGREECLMRRTLNAHIDYIYSQTHEP